MKTLTKKLIAAMVAGLVVSGSAIGYENPWYIEDQRRQAMESIHSTNRATMNRNAMQQRWLLQKQNDLIEEQNQLLQNGGKQIRCYTYSIDPPKVECFNH